MKHATLAVIYIAIGAILHSSIDVTPKLDTPAVAWTTPINNNPQVQHTNVWWIATSVDFENMQATYKSFDYNGSLIHTETVYAHKN